MKKIYLITIGLLLMSIGCIGVIEVPPDENDDPIDTGPYVNTWLSIPYSVKAAIAPYATGYFSPHLNRYGEYLYPSNTPYDPFDLPCYVRADFNGDGFDDFAFLFSIEEWDQYNWYVTTKLLVVLSTPYGMELSCDLTLGMVYADLYVPVEEFWSICYIPPGYHSLVTWVNGIEITETIYLDNDAFFLASLCPEEESIFYAVGDIIYEIDWSGWRLNKRAVSSEPRTRNRNAIPFKKNRENRKRMLRP